MSDGLMELPEGWELVTLGQLGEWSSGGTPSRKNIEYYGGEIPWIKTGDLTDGLIKEIEETITQEGLINSSAKIFPNGSLVVAMYGATIGKLGILNKPAATNQACAVLISRSITTYLIPYLFYYLLGRREDLRMIGQGGAQPNISQAIIKEYSCPLPPLNEQKRIVAKIEELNNRTRKAKEALEAIPELCDRFRQSVLAAAFRGDLTADWREQNPNVEPASVLLERIRKERRQCWESNLLTQGKNPKKSKYQEPVEIEDENFSLLPDTWCWTTLGNLTWSVKDGPHFSPKYSESGIPFISGGNVRPEGIDFQNVKYISPELHKELSERCVPEIGDILYTKGGTTGIARVNTYTHQFNVWVHVAVLKCVPSIERFYLQNALNSPHCYEQSQKFTHGVGNQDLGLTRMIKITIPLAPLEEQKIIVERINKYMDFIGNIEKLIYISKEKVDQLNQSILAKAFRGELVPQYPDDEPASKLLERIRAEREKLNNSKPKAKPTSSRKTKTPTTQRTIPGLE